MKKIFFVGDFFSNTGPAIVNKEIKLTLGEEDFYYSKNKGKISRILELTFKIIFSNNVCFCSFSKLNKLGIKISKIFHKKTCYIMHGFLKREYEINSIDNSVKLALEDYILNNVDMVICVSKSSMNFVKKYGYKTKFSYFYNNINKPEKINSHVNNNVVMSTGGLIPLKNNLEICKAIKIINDSDNDVKLKYIILGNSFNLKKELEKYDFVEFYETIPHDKCISLMKSCNLYIQNSEFETFGLSVIEALLSGCSILISKNVGAKDILKNINDDSIIFDTRDTKEIANKILKIINKPNNAYLLKTIEFEKYTKNIQLKRLVNLILNGDK